MTPKDDGALDLRPHLRADLLRLALECRVGCGGDRVVERRIFDDRVERCGRFEAERLRHQPGTRFVEPFDAFGEGPIGALLAGAPVVGQGADALHEVRHLRAGLRDDDVGQEGVEGALRTLFRHGVYLTVDEFKGRPPVQRGRATIEVTLDVDGTGTAAVISPVGELGYKGEKYVINGGKTGALTQKLYDTIVGIQYGTAPDPHGWVYPLG